MKSFLSFLFLFGFVLGVTGLTAEDTKSPAPNKLGEVIPDSDGDHLERELKTPFQIAALNPVQLFSSGRAVSGSGPKCPGRCGFDVLFQRDVGADVPRRADPVLRRARRGVAPTRRDRDAAGADAGRLCFFADRWLLKIDRTILREVVVLRPTRRPLLISSYL